MPSGRPIREYPCGEEHAPNAETTPSPFDSWHSNVRPGSSENDQDGERPLPNAPGPESMEGAAGAVLSSA